MVIRTDDKMKDGSFIYIHKCSRCNVNSYRNRKGCTTGYCTDCLSIIRSERSKIVSKNARNRKLHNKLMNTLLIKEGVSKEAMHEMFYYVPEGLLLYKDTYGSKAQKDHIVGNTDAFGYRSVSINGVNYSVAYLVWVYHNGYLDKTTTIYRKNKIPSDTRIENLTLDNDSTFMTTEEFIVKALNVHNYKYKYTNTEYKSSKEPVLITCDLHGEFSQVAHTHLIGAGCPCCGIKGFKKDKPAILYYLRVDGNLYKIGITNYTVRERYSLSDMEKIEILKEIPFSDGIECYKTEQMLLKKYKEYAYKGNPILSSGNTELFTVDISRLEDSINLS
jgi:hypothetical protein